MTSLVIYARKVTPMYDQLPVLPNECVFYGRWDLRRKDRAVTVKSGSYVYLRFSGAWIAAHFDLGVNQPPFPTLAWRIDDLP